MLKTYQYATDELDFDIDAWDNPFVFLRSQIAEDLIDLGIKDMKTYDADLLAIWYDLLESVFVVLMDECEG